MLPWVPVVGFADLSGELRWSLLEGHLHPGLYRTLLFRQLGQLKPRGQEAAVRHDVQAVAGASGLEGTERGSSQKREIPWQISVWWAGSMNIISQFGAAQRGADGSSAAPSSNGYVAAETRALAAGLGLAMAARFGRRAIRPAGVAGRGPQRSEGAHSARGAHLRGEGLGHGRRPEGAQGRPWAAFGRRAELRLARQRPAAEAARRAGGGPALGTPGRGRLGRRRSNLRRCFWAICTCFCYLHCCWLVFEGPATLWACLLGYLHLSVSGFRDLPENVNRKPIRNH